VQGGSLQDKPLKCSDFDAQKLENRYTAQDSKASLFEWDAPQAALAAGEERIDFVGYGYHNPGDTCTFPRNCPLPESNDLDALDAIGFAGRNIGNESEGRSICRT
jgi:hypothetical protein